MDLFTVKKNYQTGKYSHIEDIFNDIQTIWSNCKLYNRQESVKFYFSFF